MRREVKKDMATKRSRSPRRKAADPMMLMNVLAGKWASQAVGVVADLRVADLLKNSTKTAAEIAKATETSADGMYRLLRALAGIGLFTESAGQRFRLTPLGQCLRTDAALSVGGFARFMGHDSTWRPWGQLQHSVRTTEPAFDRVFGMPIFDYLGGTPEAASVFQGAMTSISTMEGTAAVDAYDFSRLSSVVDVAGGHGLLIAKVLKSNRKMRGVLFDLPNVVSGAGPVLHAHGVANRCQVVGGSFFDAVPEGADAYMMKHIIHDWDDDRAIQILRTCHRAMNARGVLLIIDVVLDSKNAGHYGHLLDLEMLVLTPRGRERTKAEFDRLLKRSGFKLRRGVPTDGYLSIVEAVKSAA
jgi:hypothetical protein